MKISELIQDLNAINIIGNTEIEINGIVFDSRDVKPGNVFVCIEGEKFDGHDFVNNAVKNGASAIIAQRHIDNIAIPLIVTNNTRISLALAAARFCGFPQRMLKLIGITGTNGKTTITYLLKSILESTGAKVGLIGTNQNIIGPVVIKSKHTTPDSLELMELFSRMVEAGVEYVAMEVSSHSLALDRVAALEFDIAVFTNITQDHLDFHGTMENYFEAKAKLFDMCKCAVVNIDNERGADIAARCSGNVISYGIKQKATITGSNLKTNEHGITLDIEYNGKTYPAFLGIPGEFSAYNGLGAVAAAIASGLTIESAIDGLRIAKGVKGRVEVVDTGLDYTVIIDYAHTPDGLRNVLETIRSITQGRLITLFGCGGDRDKTKRPQMGAIAAEISDICVITTDNPRSENPTDIINDILTGFEGYDCKKHIIENRFEAIEFALDIAEKGDVVLLAGKGHETYQILSDGIIDFDEREIVLKLLNVV